MLFNPNNVYDVLLFIFVLVVVAHMTVNKTSQQDKILLIFAMIVMIMYYISRRGGHENFEEPATALPTPSLLEEKIPEISTLNLRDKTILYVSSFNSQSYNGSGRIWKNIAKLPSSSQCPDTSSSPGNLVFSSDPIFNKTNGFTLKSTSLKGPLSCSLGLNMNSSFSIFVAFKNNDLANVNGDIEIIKLYGNSDTNRGISLSIPSGSIKVLAEGLYTCQLKLTFANMLMSCIMKDKLDIVMEANLMTFFFITKSADMLNVYMITEKYGKSPTPALLLTKSLTTSVDGNFSNRELEINTNKNWNVGIFNVGIFNVALDNLMMTNLYLNVMNYYNRSNDEQYTKLLQENKTVTDANRQLNTCPFDETTCNKCANITWTNPLGVMSLGSSECKKSIHQFCSQNPGHSNCTPCWSSASGQYNSESCIAMRSLFGSDSSYKSSIINELTEAELEPLKQKYQWIKKDQCPVAVAAATSVSGGSAGGSGGGGSANPQSKPQIINTGISDFYPGGDARAVGEPIKVQGEGPVNYDIRKETPDSIWSTVKSIFV